CYINDGDFMKNIIAIILGCGVSILVALFFMPHTEEASSIPVMSEITTKTVQVGVFLNEDKAISEANRLDARVIKENGYYYLYYSVLSEDENIQKIMEHLDKSGIKYFLKAVNTSQEFKDNLIQYEEMMKHTTSSVAFLELNKRIMDMYEASYEN
ncbi:MAG: hypothetical protein K2I70_04105, partial [Bacilli bacterium]|nr:hypothetical protein [Bacilli bacterium]